MRRSTSQRIARLEERAGIGPNPPPSIVLLGSNHVANGGQTWDREFTESEREFHGRVVRDLYEAGYPSPIFICFGNKPKLPPPGP